MGNYVNNVGLNTVVLKLKKYIDNLTGTTGTYTNTVDKIDNKYVDKACLKVVANKFKSYIAQYSENYAISWIYNHSTTHVSEQYTTQSTTQTVDVVDDVMLNVAIQIHITQSSGSSVHYSSGITFNVNYAGQCQMTVPSGMSYKTFYNTFKTGGNGEYGYKTETIYTISSDTYGKLFKISAYVDYYGVYHVSFTSLAYDSSVENISSVAAILIGSQVTDTLPQLISSMTVIPRYIIFGLDNLKLQIKATTLPKYNTNTTVTMKDSNSDFVTMDSQVVKSTNVYSFYVIGATQSNKSTKDGTLTITPDTDESLAQKIYYIHSVQSPYSLSTHTISTISNDVWIQDYITSISSATSTDYWTTSSTLYTSTSYPFKCCIIGSSNNYTKVTVVVSYTGKSGNKVSTEYQVSVHYSTGLDNGAYYLETGTNTILFSTDVSSQTVTIKCTATGNSVTTLTSTKTWTLVKDN